MIAARRQRTSPTLICCAIPLGYGPAAKLAILAEALRRRGVRLIFVGRGIALEFAARHSRLFDDLVAADSPSDVSAALWRSAAGVLSLMDRDFAPAAAKFGKPLFVVDSLLWMRDELPPPWRPARRLWAQNFVGLHECEHLHAPQVNVVGPIVAACSPAAETASGRLLINLGGCDSAGGGDRAVSYCQFVVDQLLASPLAEILAGRATLIAGERCACELRNRYGSCGIEFLSLSHEDALAELDQASLVLTAPGLTMTLECFQRGAATFFLPPQNYSQWCILRALRSLDLAPAALHWEDLAPGRRLADRLPEAVRNPIVHNALADGTANPDAARMLRRCLEQIPLVDRAELASRQARFFESLGTNGVDVIVNELTAGPECGGAAPLAAAALP